jgi:SAM-dependent methyltransferase
MEHFFQHECFGENYFTYPTLYTNMVKEIPDGGSVVEIGCWKGRSISYLAVEVANSGKNIAITAVDPFTGSIEHSEMDIIKTQTLFDCFCSNIEPIKDMVRVLQMKSEDAYRLFKDESQDFVFIDGCHEWECVRKDIICWYSKIKPGGVLAGHDYIHPPVSKAVHMFLGNFGKIEDTGDGCWLFRKETQ